MQKVLICIFPKTLASQLVSFFSMRIFCAASFLKEHFFYLSQTEVSINLYLITTHGGVYMKKLLVVGIISIAAISCTKQSDSSGDATKPAPAQAAVQDNVSQKNILAVALGSKDHTTLVAAVKAAELVDVLANPGPFTVFAPTNDAFKALPAGTVEGLLKPEKKADLTTVLQYHVFVGALDDSRLKDGMTYGEVDGGDVKITRKDGKVFVNDAQILASVPASNGIVHVIDKVLLPSAKK